MTSLTHYGAKPEDWGHFDLVLGFGEDLLPVVSNPNAVISDRSKMKALGKTPSIYNGSGFAVGLPQWTSLRATGQDIADWEKEPDYGICLQTRKVRALDIDVPDKTLADEILGFFQEHWPTGWPAPVRRREGTGKCLAAFVLPGELSKRSFKVNGGIVEFLATGQQFVAIGTHPDGTRYEWEGGLPNEFPVVTLEEFEELWSELVKRFATEDPVELKATTKAATLAAAASNDPVANALYERASVISAERDGRLHIVCPFADEHTTESAESATTYFPAHTGGYAQGNFKCLHAHCEHRSQRDFLSALGIVEDPRDDFTASVVEVSQESGEEEGNRFRVLDTAEFTNAKPLSWFVKGVLPKAPLVVVWGPPGSGKSFWITDLALAVARHLPTWRGHKVTGGGVVYVAAEGASGFRNRLSAYAIHNGLEVPDLPIRVIPAAPNLMERQDVIDMGNAIIESGGVDLIIYDTFARGTPGADENSAKDMGIAIKHCQVLNEVTGATIVLVHHTGKDATKGARGSNALNGASDAEIGITRLDDNRTATVEKLKDGEDGGAFGFRLQTIAIGMDEDGDVISSCVVEHCEATNTLRRAKKMGPNEERVWAAVLDLQKPGSDSVGVEQIITAAVEATPFDGAGGKRDQRRMRMGRALDNLITNGKLKVEGGAVVIVGGKE